MQRQPNSGQWQLHEVVSYVEPPSPPPPPRTRSRALFSHCEGTPKRGGSPLVTLDVHGLACLFKKEGCPQLSPGDLLSALLSLPYPNTSSAAPARG